MRILFRKGIGFYRDSRLKTKLFIIFGLSSLLPILMFWGISTKVNERRLKQYNDAEGGSGMILTPTVIISIAESSMDEICNPAGEMEESGFNFIVAADGTVISYPDEQYAGRRIKVLAGVMVAGATAEKAGKEPRTGRATPV